MKKIKKKILNAIDYVNQNQSVSLTDAAKKFGIDRHTLSDNLKKEYDKDCLFQSCKDGDEEFLYYFSKDELECIEYYKEHSDEPFRILKEKYPNSPEKRALRNWMDILGNSYHTGNHRKYYYDDNKFQIIETEEDAYWLGFITADGCIIENRMLQIKLAESDRGHLVKFAKYLGMTAEETEEIIKDGIGGAYDKNNKTVCIKICSRKICSSLNDKNIFPRKSGKEIPYICTSKDLEIAYIRGLIDGDGWIRSTQFGLGLCGSYEICNYVKNFVNDNIIDTTGNSINSHDIIWKLELNGKIKASTILDTLYQNATIYLDRKYQIYQEIYKN